MSTEVKDQTQDIGVSYGYESDDVAVSTFNFGLNAGATFLKVFKWIPNGGKDGAEGEALDIELEISGTKKSYRMFPVTKAFGKNGEEITDRSATEFKTAVKDFNARITHFLHCFVDVDVIQTAFSRPIANFKQFCEMAGAILPTNFPEIPLDIFLNYQWQISDGQNRTFLEIPKKMSYGRFLSKAVIPEGGEWKENRSENPTDATREALFYTDGAGNKHPFVRNGWFMLSNFANQQKGEGSPISGDAASTPSGAANNTTPPTGTAATTPAAW